MANAFLEKAKTFGIRHGEKVAVAIVSALTGVMLLYAFNRGSIDVTAEQINSSTTRARQNLSKVQPKDEIVKKITDQGIVQPKFVEVVDSRKPGMADASRYKLTNLMVTPEPGAGLLRDAPELVGISKLEIHPGRGAIKLLELDPATGDIVYESASEETSQPKQKSGRRTRRNNRGGAAGGGMGGMMGMGGAAGANETPQQKRDREKAEREQAATLKKSIAGNVKASEESSKAEEKAEPAPGSKPKETLKGFRWMAFTAWVDHKKLRDNFAKALKIDPSAAQPHYIRVELERQQRNADGSWTAWKPVDRRFSEDKVFNLLTEIEAETNEQGVPITEEDVRLEELVDKLPFLENGYWVGVHHAELINPKALETPKKAAPAGGMMGGMGGPGGMMGGPGGMGGMGGGPAGKAGGMGGPGGMMGGPAGKGGGPAGKAGGMGGPAVKAGGMGKGGMEDEGMGGFGKFFGGGGGSAASGADGKFSKSDADKVMIRQLDFTVKPDTAYRYRGRLVIANPNYGSNDVMPGVDRDSKEFFTAWSDASLAATVPPDVETYVYRLPPADVRNKRPDLIEFNVVRWNPENGLTLVKPFMYGPGSVVGEPASVRMPIEEKGKVKTTSKSVDFTSHRLLVDTTNGTISTDRIGINTSAFNPTPSALLLRADGMIELRDEAFDAVAGEMDEMLNIYKQTLKDAEGEKKSSQMSGRGMMGGGMGGGMGGMMGGGMGGMMGGGMGGGCRGRGR